MVMKKSLLGFLVVGLIFLGVLWQAHSDQMESMEAYMTASERYRMDYQPIPMDASAELTNRPIFLKWIIQTDLLNFYRHFTGESWAIITEEFKYQSNPSPLVNYVSPKSTEGRTIGLALPVTTSSDEKILLLTVPEAKEKEIDEMLLETVFPQEMHKRLVEEKKLAFKLTGSELKKNDIESINFQNREETQERFDYFSDYTMRGMMQLYADRVKKIAKTGQKDTLSPLKINHFSLVRLKQWEVIDISVAEKPVVFAKLTTRQPVGVALWVEENKA